MCVCLGVRGRWGSVCGCDCVGVGVIVLVGVGVIAWMKKGVCGWDSLDCCRKVCVCVARGGRGERSVCECDCVCVGGIVLMGVGVIAWMKKGVCGWDSLDCCRKVCVCVLRGEGEEKGVCVSVTVCVLVSLC